MQRDGDAARIRTQLAARRDRRLGLSAAVDAAGRAAAARDDRRAAARHHRRRLLAAPARPECAGGHRLYRRDRAGGDRGGRPDGGGPPRHRPARRHLGRPAQCRLDRGAARARTRARACALAYRAAAGRRAAALRHRHRARRPSGDAGLARRACMATRARARRRAFRPDRLAADLYRHYGIDANAIIAAAQGLTPGRPIRYLKALP